MTKKSILVQGKGVDIVRTMLADTEAFEAQRDEMIEEIRVEADKRIQALVDTFDQKHNEHWRDLLESQNLPVNFGEYKIDKSYIDLGVAVLVPDECTCGQANDGLAEILGMGEV